MLSRILLKNNLNIVKKLTKNQIRVIILKDYFKIKGNDSHKYNYVSNKIPKYKNKVERCITWS